jgi:peroxiredoxin
MALTYSTMIDLGSKAPDFSLPDTLSGRQVQLSDFAQAQVLVVMFLCNHCPYVVHINPELLRMGADYAQQSVAFVGISSNDTEKYPQDAPDKMQALGLELGYPFPYLFDESQAVAKAYDAACTPDFFVFDADRRLVYRGRLDDSRPQSSTPLSGRDLRGAIDAVLNNQPVVSKQYPSMGCNIKWKA